MKYAEILFLQKVGFGNDTLTYSIPEGMNLKVGDDVVIIATNKDGSVNGMNFRISGISENILGPQGKDGYIHIDDAKSKSEMGIPHSTQP